MNAFDASIIGYLSHFARRSPLLDHAVAMLAGNHFVKGAPLMAMLWWLWFRDDAPEQRQRVRGRIIGTFAAAFVGLVVGRSLALLLPYRVRPLYDVALAAVLPTGTEHGLQTWSSFPSDHATMFCAVATGILFISRPNGLLALLHVALLVCLPRVYLGLHYPTDVLAGAVLGAGVAWVICGPRLRPLWHWSLRRIEAHPAGFYAAAFLLTFEMASMFDEFRLATAFVQMALHPGASSVHAAL
jgi:membrane-associated phospholipid phosphatase